MFIECSGFLLCELPSYLLPTFIVCCCPYEFIVCGLFFFYEFSALIIWCLCLLWVYDTSYNLWNNTYWGYTMEKSQIWLEEVLNIVKGPLPQTFNSVIWVLIQAIHWDVGCNRVPGLHQPHQPRKPVIPLAAPLYHWPLHDSNSFTIILVVKCHFSLSLFCPEFNHFTLWALLLPCSTSSCLNWITAVPPQLASCFHPWPLSHSSKGNQGCHFCSKPGNEGRKELENPH